MKQRIVACPKTFKSTHVSLIVADTERSVAFYSGLLGLTLDRQRPDLGYPGTWLWVGEQQIHLLELPDPDPS